MKKKIVLYSAAISITGMLYNFIPLNIQNAYAIIDNRPFFATKKPRTSLEKQGVRRLPRDNPGAAMHNQRLLPANRRPVQSVGTTPARQFQPIPAMGQPSFSTPSQPGFPPSPMNMGEAGAPFAMPNTPPGYPQAMPSNIPQPGNNYMASDMQARQAPSHAYSRNQQQKSSSFFGNMWGKIKTILGQEEQPQPMPIMPTQPQRPQQPSSAPYQPYGMQPPPIPMTPPPGYMPQLDNTAKDIPPMYMEPSFTPPSPGTPMPFMPMSPQELSPFMERQGQAIVPNNISIDAMMRQQEQMMIPPMPSAPPSPYKAPPMPSEALMQPIPLYNQQMDSISQNAQAWEQQAQEEFNTNPIAPYPIPDNSVQEPSFWDTLLGREGAPSPARDIQLNEDAMPWKSSAAPSLMLPVVNTPVSWNNDIILPEPETVSDISASTVAMPQINQPKTGDNTLIPQEAAAIAKPNKNPNRPGFGSWAVPDSIFMDQPVSEGAVLEERIQQYQYRGDVTIPTKKELQAEIESDIPIFAALPEVPEVESNPVLAKIDPSIPVDASVKPWWKTIFVRTRPAAGENESVVAKQAMPAFPFYDETAGKESASEHIPQPLPVLDLPKKIPTKEILELRPSERLNDQHSVVNPVFSPTARKFQAGMQSNQPIDLISGLSLQEPSKHISSSILFSDKSNHEILPWKTKAGIGTTPDEGAERNVINTTGNDGLSFLRSDKIITLASYPNLSHVPSVSKEMKDSSARSNIIKQLTEERDALNKLRDDIHKSDTPTEESNASPDDAA